MSCCHVPYFADKGSAVATERKLVKKRQLSAIRAGWRWKTWKRKPSNESWGL